MEHQTQELLNQVHRPAEVTQSQAGAPNEMQQRQQQSQMDQKQRATLERLVEMQGIVVKLPGRPESSKRATHVDV